MAKHSASKGKGHGGPARGYKWEPFQPGHELTLKHGAYSPRRVDPLAEELVGQVLDVAEVEGLSFLTQASYRPALWSWARAEARIQLLEEWLAEHADAALSLDHEGEVMAAVKLLERVERRAVTLRSRLGLDPLSRARLGRDVAAQQVDLARYFAEQHRDEQQQQEDDGGDDDG